MMPLVSIVVITYNSENYILDALESILSQTYKRIELIISDDCSIDDTLLLFSQWLPIHKDRFERVNVITTKKNTGITENCLRGYMDSQGEWIKILAGDDTLEKTCITDFIEFVKKDPNIKVVQSGSNYYKDYFSKTNYLYTRSIKYDYLHKLPSSLKFQRIVLILTPSVNAPTLFINKAYIKSIGYHDTNIKDMDDWPLWLKINSNNTIIHGLDKTTVNYRIRSSSISNNGSIVNSNYKEMYQFQKQYLWKELTSTDKCFINYEYFIKIIWNTFHLTGSNYIIKLVYILLNKPVEYYKLIRLKFYYNKYR